MPSPFPGMDPFIEMNAWSNFHFDLIAQIKRDLQPRVAPNYLIDTETRVYVESLGGGDSDEYIPVLSIRSDPRSPAQVSPTAGALFAEIEPEEYQAPWPQEQREPFLLVRDRRNSEVVTVIELLLPTNKRPGSVGSQEYAHKRAEFLAAHVNFVEVDLLRCGARLPLNRPYKDDTDYCVFLFRRQRRSTVFVYQWPLRHVLPKIPIPLSEDTPEVELNLQQALRVVYDDLNYRLRLPYEEPLQPPARVSDAEWVAARAAEAKTT